MAKLQVEIDATKAQAGAQQFAQATGLIQTSTLRTAEGLSRTEREVLKLSRGISVLAGASGSREIFEVGNLLSLLSGGAGGILGTAAAIGAVALAVRALSTDANAASKEFDALFQKAKAARETANLIGGIVGAGIGQQAGKQERDAVDKLIASLKELEEKQGPRVALQQGLFQRDILSPDAIQRLQGISGALTETGRSVTQFKDSFIGIPTQGELVKETFINIDAAIKGLGDRLNALAIAPSIARLVAGFIAFPGGPAGGSGRVVGQTSAEITARRSLENQQDAQSIALLRGRLQIEQQLAPTRARSLEIGRLENAIVEVEARQIDRANAALRERIEALRASGGASADQLRVLEDTSGELDREAKALRESNKALLDRNEATRHAIALSKDLAERFAVLAFTGLGGQRGGDNGLQRRLLDQQEFADLQRFQEQHALLAQNIQGGVGTLANALGSAAAGFISLREAGVSALRSIEAQLVSTISQALIFRYLINPFLSSFGVAFGSTGQLTTPTAAATSFGAGTQNITVNVAGGSNAARRTSRQAAEDFFRQGRVG